MAIDGGLRNKLQPGMRLAATYKKAEHTAEVVEGEDKKLRFRLADGREFTSPSAAGSAVMGGIACNGWRFWSIATDEPDSTPKTATKAKAPAAAAEAASETLQESDASEQPAAAE